MERVTVWTILYVLISGLKGAYGEICTEQTGTTNVYCTLLTVENGHVCYVWHWVSTTVGKIFSWSSATLSCNFGYELSSSENVLLCERSANGTSYSWNGSFPECQKQAAYGEDCIEQTSTTNVYCKLLTVENGHVCYVWHWVSTPLGKRWSWSSATLSCNSGYELSSSENMLLCERSASGPSYSWNGSFPECQKQETTDLSSSSTTANRTSTPPTTRTTKTTTPVSTKTSLAATTTITTQTTPQVTKPVTILINRSSTVGRTNLPSAQDRRNLLPLYVAVPAVVFVGAVVLAVLFIVRKRQSGLISNCRGKAARKELSYRIETNEPCYRNLQLDDIVDECQEVDKAYTSLRIERDNGVYEAIGSGAVPTNTDKQPETIAGGQTIDDKAYTGLCILKENDAYSILGNGSIKLNLDKQQDTYVNERSINDKQITSLGTLR